MFSKLKLLAGVLLLTVLAGCATTNVAAEKKASPIRFDYQANNREEVGLIRGFDDGYKTILQFISLDRSTVELYDTDNTLIPGVRRIGSYLVLPRIYRTVFVRIGKKEAVVIRDSADNPDIQLGQAPKGAPPISAESLAASSAAAAGATPVMVKASAPANPAPAAVTVSAVPPAPAAPEARPVKSFPLWEIQARDLSVYSAFRRWARSSGWQISWEIPVDYPATVLHQSSGTFEDAVDSVLAAYAKADYPPKGCFHTNQTPPVLRVVRRDGTGHECER